jgi:hypothetical protein
VQEQEEHEEQEQEEEEQEGEEEQGPLRYSDRKRFPAPRFSDQARGTPQLWNNEKLCWNKKHHKRFRWDVDPDAFVDITQVMEFLCLRPLPDGESAVSRLGDPQRRLDGWWCLPWLAFAEADLPRESSSVEGGEADWALAWHLVKL